MSRRLKTLLAALFLVLAPVVAQANLLINFTADGTGGTNLEFDGSGTVLSSGSFVYYSPATAFYMLTGWTSSLVAPNAVLGGGTVGTLFAGQSGAPAQSVEWFWPGVGNGNSLSDADGLTFDLPTLNFSNFIQGTYALTRFSGFADVGDVTLVIGPRAEIPEPASLALIGLGLAGLGFSRRRKA